MLLEVTRQARPTATKVHPGVVSSGPEHPTKPLPPPLTRPTRIAQRTARTAAAPALVSAAAPLLAQATPLRHREVARATPPDHVAAGHGHGALAAAELVLERQHRPLDGRVRVAGAAAARVEAARRGRRRGGGRGRERRGHAGGRGR